MAKLTFSVLVADVRGKAGDVVFSSWKGRSYARTRVTPSNPNTAAQQAVRNSMASVVAQWQSLTSTLKGIWNVAASALSLSGYNLFVSQNRADEEDSYGKRFLPLQAPGEPVTTFAVALGGASGQMDVTWASAAATATDDMDFYVRKNGSDDWVHATFAAVVVSDEAATLTGLTPAATYDVAAFNVDAATGLVYAPSSTIQAAAGA